MLPDPIVAAALAARAEEIDATIEHARRRPAYLVECATRDARILLGDPGAALTWHADVHADGSPQARADIHDHAYLTWNDNSRQIAAVADCPTCGHRTTGPVRSLTDLGHILATVTRTPRDQP